MFQSDVSDVIMYNHFVVFSRVKYSSTVVQCSTVNMFISARDNWVQLYLPRCVARLCDSAQLTTMSMSLPASVPSSPRSTRPLSARKQPNDPAWFSTNTTSVTSVKRQVMERIEGEPRNKRKRVVEPTLQTPSQLGHRVDKPQERQNDELPVVCIFTPYPRRCFPWDTP